VTLFSGLRDPSDGPRPPGLRCQALKELLGVLRPGARHAVLDLGPPLAANVQYLAALSCRVRIADLHRSLSLESVESRRPEAVGALLDRLLPLAPGERFDALLAWDVFDYLDRGEAAALAKRLVALLRPGGLLMALFTTERRTEAASRRYIIADADHLRHRPAPGARWARTVWPLGDIEVLLAPLEVRQSHLLAHRQREMLLRRPTAPGKDG